MNFQFRDYILVAMGGALGAMTRLGVGHLISQFTNNRYPWHTFAINSTGSLLLGYAVILTGTRSSATTQAFYHLVAIGFLGAFTTFSTFELETWNLLQTGRTTAAVTYVLTSVLVGLAALWVGITLARLLHF